MSRLDETKIDIMPSAVPPTEAERAAWRELSRDEQTRRYREALTQAECGIATEDGMDEILAEARRRVAARRG